MTTWIKATQWFKWIYDWITVIAAALVGVPSIILSLLSLLDGVDISPFLPPEHALKIVTGIALLKGVVAYIVNLIGERRTFNAAYDAAYQEKFDREEPQE